MSRNTALAFIRRLEIDAGLQQKLADLNQGDMNCLIGIASREGYPFTAEDWFSAIESIMGNRTELTENDLMQVAGGLNPQPEPPAPIDLLVKLNPGLILGGMHKGKF